MDPHLAWGLITRQVRGQEWPTASAVASGMAVSGRVMGQRCVSLGISCRIMTAHGVDQLQVPRPPWNVLCGQARGRSLWVGLSGLPWLPSLRLRQGPPLLATLWRSRVQVETLGAFGGRVCQCTVLRSCRDLFSQPTLPMAAGFAFPAPRL